MAVMRHVMRYGQFRVARRLARAVPWVGAAVAVLAVGSAIRRKGVVGGTVDTALNAVPLLGAAKGVVESIRGRDFIPDRRLLP